MNIQGKLHVKFDTQQVSDKFTKREFVIEFAENPMYPQYVLLQLIQDKVNLLDSYEVGAMLDVSFNLKGRSWTSPQGETKYFNSLEAWRITPAQVSATAGAPDIPPPPPLQSPVVNPAVSDGDLPF